MPTRLATFPMLSPMPRRRDGVEYATARGTISFGLSPIASTARPGYGTILVCAASASLMPSLR